MGLPAAPATPESLAERAAHGDTDATAKLLRLVAPGMLRTAHALLGRGHPDVDDVAQQSMIALVQALPSFRGECAPAHFANSITTRFALAARRRQTTRATRTDDAIEVDTLFSDARTAVDHVLAEKRRSAIRELLGTLPEVQAETLALRVVLGLSLGEVAAATNVPLNTVRSRIRLAKEALMKRIEADATLLELLEPSP
ncbi:MAG: sigma-70 family RNA polymerase sigma factor [Myxococcaceae bacterium]|nr:sigma-70 family RNA polymerase sigma factor [Myxococcaceae bacterium]